MVRRAEIAIDFKLGDQVSEALSNLRAQLARRITELEQLCHSTDPRVRMNAIALWFKLADVKQVIPNPTKPADTGSLELIQDLLITTTSEV